VVVKVFHYLAMYDVFEDFAAYWCKRNESVVSEVAAVAFLEDRCYICLLP